VLGQRVNNFEIVRLLGQGGMGTVYEAEHLLIRKKVAVKVLRSGLPTNGDLMQRFFNEARATSAIRHPNIVEVIDLGMLPDGVPYLVMELLEGESLGDRLGRLGRLEPAVAIEFGCQTASALAAAHAEGIIHRDLKPENLYLVRDQRFPDRELVKVLDFGIAKLRDDPSASPVNTVAGTIWGTPRYMSPEQCRGVPGEIDHRTDIYALGVILYEALCGRPPFVADAPGDLMMMHMNTAPEALSAHAPDIPPHVERAVVTALAKRPQDRFTSMEQLSSALRPVVTLPVALSARPSMEGRAAASAFAALGRSSSPMGTLGRLASRAPAQGVALHALGDDDNGVTGKQFKGPRGRDAGPDTPGAGDTLAGLADTSPEPAVWHKELESERAALETDDPERAGQASRRRVIIAAAALGAVALSIMAIVRLGAHAPPPERRESPPAAAAAAVAPIAKVAEPQAPRQAPPAPTLELRPEAAKLEAPTTDKVSRAVARSGKARQARRAAAGSLVPAASTAAPKPPVAASDDSAAGPQRVSVAPGAEPGYLSLDSEPWANVFLGAKLLGTTPLMRIPLPAGKLVLTLTNPELGTSTSYVVEIKSGQALKRLVGWRKQ
jgi:serine/threonine-protein kinase